MPREPIWRDIIIKILENRSLTYETLFNEAKILVREDAIEKNKEKSLTKRPDRDFNKALVQLLNNEDVVILPKYDIKVHKYIKGNKKGKSKPIGEIQSLKIEGLNLELVKKEQYQIFKMISLLNRLDTKSEEIEKTINDLQKSFGRKLKQLQEKEVNNWNKWINKIKSERFKDIKNLRPDLKEYLKDDENAVLWYLKEVSGEELDLLLPKTEYQKKTDELRTLGYEGEDAIRERCKSITNRPAVLFGKVQEQSYTPNEIVERMDKMGFYLVEINGKWVNSQNTDIPTRENFLLELGLIKKPIQKNDAEISKILRIILFNIMNSENYKVLQNSFAWALSDEKDSLEWFKLFIEGMSDITPLKEILSKQLNKKSKNEMDKYEIEAAAIRKANENRGKIHRYNKSNDLGEQLTTIIKEIVSQN